MSKKLCLLFLSIALLLGAFAANADTGEAMQAYATAMRNETEIYLSDGGEWSDPARAQSMLLDDFLASFSVPFHAYAFAVVDMDQDGASEVVLDVRPIGSAYNYGFEVLHYDGQTVYGNLFFDRGMMDLQQDGSFGYSNGAMDYGVGRLAFPGGVYDYIMFAGQEHNNSNPVIWHDFTPESIDTCLSF